MKYKLISFLGLFTSASTLICCALPALFVALGLGATFAGLLTHIPQLIWVSEHKTSVFGFGAVMLIAGGVLQWRSANEPCPVDRQQADACRNSRRWSHSIYCVSLALYGVGLFFSFII
jgi:hypothetical protein